MASFSSSTPASATHRNSHQAHTRAILFMMVSVGLYTLQDVFIKLLPPHISLVEIFFFRSVFGLIFIIPMILKERHPRPFKTKHPWLHFLRAFSTILATFSFISAFRLMPLAEAYAITFSAPIFMIVLAIFFLREKSTFQQWIALIIGFIGVIVIFRPGPLEANPGSLIALSGGVFHAITQLLTRKLSQKDSLSLVITSFTFLAFFITGLMMPFYWQSYTLEMMISFALIGILGCGAQYLMSKAFQIAPIPSIAPYDYVALLWGMFFDAFLWHSFPDHFMLSGAVLIMVAGLFLMHNEKKRASKAFFVKERSSA